MAGWKPTPLVLQQAGAAAPAGAKGSRAKLGIASCRDEPGWPVSLLHWAIVCCLTEVADDEMHA
jgi:hypothetical protein